jgi:hypothetical protein
MKWAYLNWVDLVPPDASVRDLIPINLVIFSAPQMETSHEVPKMPG